jgi:hypothetical protein
MRTYVLITGVIFGLLTFAHIWRVVAEGAHAAGNPWFIGTTIAAAGMCLWAVRLLRQPAR